MSPQGWLDQFQAENGKRDACTRAAALWPLVTDRCFVSAWLQERLQAMSGSPVRLPQGYHDPVLQSLVMLDDSRLQLSLAMIDAARWQQASSVRAAAGQIIEFADGWTRLHFIHAAQVNVQLHYRRSDPSAQIRTEAVRAVVSGQQFELDNARDSLRFVDVGEDCLVLRLLVRNPAQRHATEHDAATGALLRTRQAQSHEARVQMSLSLLRSLGRADLVERVSERMQGWPPDLRWHAVREALMVDARQGLALLERMISDDPLASVRALAEATRDHLLALHPQLSDMV